MSISVLALVVHVTLFFDPSITSGVIRTNATREAASIWQDYGVDLDWSGGGASLCVAAFINRSRGPVAEDARTGSVLGSTIVPDEPNLAPAPIRIGFDAVDELAEPSALRNPILHEFAVGTAIGRVLAHELGHILLGAPGYHDIDGLMRPNFMANDFMPWARARYRLADGSVARLHDRLASLAAVHPAPGCPAL